MSWLRDLVKPSIATARKRDVKANVWEQCPSCNEMIYRQDLEAALHVCPSCNHHLRLPVDLRLTHLADEGTLTSLPVPRPKEDSLKFKDSKSYPTRLKDARKKTGEQDAFRLVSARIQGVELIICTMDFDFMGGSMGTHVGEAIVQGATTAAQKGLPFLMVTASGGARMQEGILSLMQMARTTAALAELKEKGLPYVVLLTDPTTGGVTASFAMLGDITLAEPGALIGFAGPRVIQQTIGETLPEGFQTAEYLLEHGMVDRIVSRTDQPAEIATILKILTHA